MSDSATPWTVVYQAPMSMGFHRQEHWNGLPFPSPGNLPNQGLNLCLLHWQVYSFPLSHQGSPCLSISLSSVAQSCLTLCNLMHCGTPGFPVHHQLLELAQTHIHWVSDAIQPFHPPSCPLLLPSIFSCIRVFSNESALHNSWLKYWSFSFSSSPSNEYSGFISFRINWFELLAVQGTLKSLLQYHSSKASIL